jgi:hypothetical protein
VPCERPLIGEDRKSLADDQNDANDPFRTWAAAAQSHSITWSAMPGIDRIMARGAHQLRRHIAL